MENGFAYGGSARKKKPYKSRVKHYGAADTATTDSYPPAASYPAHKPSAPSISRYESPHHPQERGSSSRKPLRNHGSPTARTLTYESPPPHSRAVSSDGSSASDNESSEEINDNDASGSFPSVMRHQGVAPNGGNISLASSSTDDADDTGSETEYEIDFVDESEYADMNYEESETSGDVKTKEATQRYEQYRQGLTKSMSTAYDTHRDEESDYVDFTYNEGHEEESYNPGRAQVASGRKKREKKYVKDDGLASPAHQQAIVMASLASAAVAKRQQQMGSRNSLTRATELAMPEIGNEFSEQSASASVSETNKRSSRIREERDKKLAAALAAGAVLKKSNLVHKDISQKTKPTKQEPRRIVDLKPVSNVEALKERKRRSEALAAESREKNGPFLVPAKSTSHRKGSPRKLFSYEVPKRRQHIVDVYTGEPIDPEMSDSSLEPRTKQPTATRSVPTPRSAPAPPKQKLYSYHIPKRQKHSTDIYTGEIITPDNVSVSSKNNSSSSSASSGSSESSDQRKTSAKPSWFPARSAPVTHRGNPNGDMSGSSSSSSSSSSSGDDSSKSSTRRTPCIVCTLVLLIMLGGVGAAVYFLVFFESDGDKGTEGGGSDTTAPVLPPSPAEPTASPVERPTRWPTRSPVLSPTLGPVESLSDTLSDILVASWPSLEGDFITTSSPQSQALDWLSSNENLGSYTNDKIVQRFTMATLYFSMNGDEWLNKDLWLTDEDECMWYSGSTSREPCNKSGSLINLELDLNDLSGTIPSELALLSDSLTRIDFTRAGVGPFLSGSLPPSLGMLSRLEYFSLKGNRLTGIVPKEVGNWQQVSKIDLSNNFFSQNLPSEIGLLSELTELDLEQNDFSGSLPSTIGTISNLRVLNLGNNNFDGQIPSEIGNLKALEDINFEENRFTFLPSEIGNLPLLKSFSALDNKLSGTIPKEIGELGSIRRLDLGGNSFTGTIPPEMGDLMAIQGMQPISKLLVVVHTAKKTFSFSCVDLLNLSQNRLSGPIPQELGKLILLRKKFAQSLGATQ